MKIGILKEITPDEKRVAAAPKNIPRFKKMGFEVLVEKDAGVEALYPDTQYEGAGATITTRETIFKEADLILKVLPPTIEEVAMMKEGTLLMSYLYPAMNQDLLKKLAEKKVNAIAMDAIPRISRAQKMDVLSSMANIAGYRAVIEAAFNFGRFMNGQITAAGKVEPAKVLVIGAGVAGLAAIGIAKSLGAIVRAFDTRKEVREQIQSMGAQFLTVDIEEDGSTESGYSKEMSQAFIEAEMALFKKQAQEVDIIITTAQIPGKPAPKLILEDHVNVMKPGSIIVDLAASTGGNCVLTKPGEIYTTPNGVTIIGKVNMMPMQASFLLGNNFANMLEDMRKDGQFFINMDDDVVNRAMVVYQGEIHWPPAPLAVSAKKAATPTALPTPEELAAQEAKKSRRKTIMSFVWLGIIAILFYLLGQVAPPAFMSHFTVFVLSVFLGWNLIWNVTHALHTPLMSVTNAISGIIAVGGILMMGEDLTNPITIMALIAFFIASINIVGGFFVTYRMLKMFKK
ncbi:MAG: Re/Si-specific NAD(P)(+) transhydrogenase subunit alpha [Bacteroidales bacterium]|nr:Re/Si-specific NAD(P)(+) transhydrogenase subunit alpha [Bacteroidales bacterium]